MFIFVKIVLQLSRGDEMGDDGSDHISMIMYLAMMIKKLVEN